MTLSWIDWAVMLCTLLSIVAYGVWQTRKVNSVQGFLLGDKDLPWWTIGLSIMATQASAITFLSTPGQAYDDGMGFAQFYFGMPVAMVLLAVFVLPIYYRLNVYSAYQYLEGRFNPATRLLTAFLFLLMRGMSAGITIFAPSIILSSLLGWNLSLTNISMTVLVIFYTVMGGTKAVSVTQKQQMIIILSGLILTAILLVFKLPQDISFSDSIAIAGEMGKLELVDFTFDLSNRYNFWSGMIGGVFLFMAYFGTDQSQVQRYLSGKSLTESRLGLMFNGLVKVPMQLLVLFVGVLVFVFFLFVKPPLHFNSTNVDKIVKVDGPAYAKLEADQNRIFEERQSLIRTMLDPADVPTKITARNQLNVLQAEQKNLREEARTLISEKVPDADTNDRDYVFITFVINYLPIGMIGLLLAIIFSAAMSSIASELNALATISVVDMYQRFLVTEKSDQHYLRASRLFTILWGLIALSFAQAASLFENLIQAVNIIGSLFYGVILGIFLTGFFLKFVRGWSVFIAALLGEAVVVGLFWMTQTGQLELAFLWLNLIGCAAVMGFAVVLQIIFKDATEAEY